MKASLVTGDPFDYIALIPENLAEGSDLIRICLSEFPRDKERITIRFPTLGTMEMRIRISDIETKHDSAINIAHDQTA